MVNFASVTTFRTRLSALLKVKRGVYAAVPDEICIAFEEYTSLDSDNKELLRMLASIVKNSKKED